MDVTEKSPLWLDHVGHLFIGGTWIEPEGSDSYEVVNPATEQALYRTALADEGDVARAVTAARSAFDDGPWPRLSHSERASFLREMADRLDRRSGELAQIWTNQVGIVRLRSQGAIKVMVDTFRYYADLAGTYPFSERHDSETTASVGVLVREPVGVVGAIVSWNGPALLIASKTVPALLAGCTVVVKASPEAPGEALLIAEVAEEVGLPPGVFNVVVADRSASESLVRDGRVDKISFTGSTPAGRRVAALCGDRIARVSLELGGKSPAVVLDDYDISTAAQTIVDATTFLSGQVCSAITRIIVSQHRHDALVEAMAEAMAHVVMGDPNDPATAMGPVASSRQRDRVEGYIRQGIEGGAQLVSGGSRPPGTDPGYFVQPTIFANVDNQSVIAQEEIFGPVVCVIPSRGEDDSVSIANDSPFGLSSAVFTDDVDRAYEVARRLRCGMVAHNAVRNELGIAFGGFKFSGLGRKGGLEGLMPFLEAKTVTLDSVPTVLLPGTPAGQRLDDVDHAGRRPALISEESKWLDA